MKKSTYGVIAILSIFAALAYSRPNHSTASLADLAPAEECCRCVPAMGYDCINTSTGAIYANYKLVCGCSEEVETLLNQ